MAGYFAEILAQLKEFEGCVPWMYRDTVGKVTVGVGLMLPDATAASALPFATPAGPALPEAITADYARVLALPEGRLPLFYRASISPELPQPEIDARLAVVLTGFEGQLRARLPKYDALPDAVKMALLDMAYNLGPTGLLNGYPHMLAAVESGAWAKAAAECFRHGISAARNAWTAQQLLSATVATIHAEADVLESEASGWLHRLIQRLRGLLKPRR